MNPGAIILSILKVLMLALLITDCKAAALIATILWLLALILIPSAMVVYMWQGKTAEE